MNVMPAMGFYMRRHEQLSKLAATANPGAVLALLDALLPVIKKYWPEYNKDGLLDDAVATLKAMFTP